MPIKDKKPTPMSVWANIDLDTVKQRINRVADQIENVLFKYELPEALQNYILQSRSNSKDQ